MLLIAAVFIAYQPAWRGGLLWDDERYVTSSEVQSWHGLYTIWFKPEPTAHYCPVLYSAFWVEHIFFGDATPGYHLVNILQHALAAILVALILRKLGIPGAFLAAAIFALHPVHVESVAWIAEQKNTLSALFYLGAALAYLGFDESRAKRSYALALVLFVAALMSKPVTATLPAALLIILWWQRGRLSWRRDIRPLVPFFLVALVSGVFAARLEQKLIVAEAVAFQLTFVERGLLAGRAIWFYLSKLLWPANLLFVYPRWEIRQSAWWQYIFPAAAILALAVLWRLRRPWRRRWPGRCFLWSRCFRCWVS